MGSAVLRLVWGLWVLLMVPRLQPWMCLQWRVKGEGSDAVYYGVNPDVPYGSAKIVSVQPHLMQDMSSGLNSTMYWITNVQANGPAVQFTVRLHCDELSTPWCSKIHNDTIM